MGEVYRARDDRLARTVALKVLPPDVAGDPGRRQRFEQEARAASALNHPNIVSVYDIGRQDGLVYIVSELIEGETLRDQLKRGVPDAARMVAYRRVAGLRGARWHPALFARRIQAPFAPRPELFRPGVCARWQDDLRRRTRRRPATSAVSSQSDLWLLEGYPRPRPWWQLWK
jgi:Protein kinase domain